MAELKIHLSPLNDNWPEEHSGEDACRVVMMIRTLQC